MYWFGENAIRPDRLIVANVYSWPNPLCARYACYDNEIQHFQERTKFCYRRLTIAISSAWDLFLVFRVNFVQVYPVHSSVEIYSAYNSEKVFNHFNFCHSLFSIKFCTSLIIVNYAQVYQVQVLFIFYSVISGSFVQLYLVLSVSSVQLCANKFT